MLRRPITEDFFDSDTETENELGSDAELDFDPDSTLTDRVEASTGVHGNTAQSLIDNPSTRR